MNENQLGVKDLITIGIYTAIYFVMMFVTGGIVRMVPFLIFGMPLFIGLTCGSIFMLYITKAQSRGMVFFMLLIIGGLMSTISGMWLTLLTSVMAGLGAELILKSKGKTTFKYILSYTVFNCWNLGAMASIWLFKDWFIEKMSLTGVETSIDIANVILPFWVFLFVVLGALIGGALGGYIGLRVMKKHFTKVGTVSCMML